MESPSVAYSTESAISAFLTNSKMSSPEPVRSSLALTGLMRLSAVVSSVSG